MIKRAKYPSSLVPSNPLWTSPNSSVPGCKGEVAAPPSASGGAQLCSGSLGKMLCNCAIPCQDPLAFPCSFQAKFLQLHDKFWFNKRRQIKRKKKPKQTKQQSKLLISAREAKISLQWDVLLFYLLWLPHLRKELCKPGCEIQREGSFSFCLLHVWAIPPHHFALSLPPNNSFSFCLRHISLDTSAAYCSTTPFPLVCPSTQPFFPEAQGTLLYRLKKSSNLG